MYWTALGTKTGALAVESKDVVESNAICFDAQQRKKSQYQVKLGIKPILIHE